MQERDPLEGPFPHLEPRLCVLLSITPLAIARVLEDAGEMPLSSLQGGSGPGNTGAVLNHGTDGKGLVSTRQGLISSLRNLGQFSGLLSPPPSVVISANNAAAKAANFISNFKNGSDSFGGSIHGDTGKSGDFLNVQS